MVTYPRLIAIFAVLAAATLAWDVTVSWHWPLYHDAQIFYFGGNLVLHGGLPYRDLFIMDFPLIFVINAAAIALLSWLGADLGMRVADLLGLLALGIAIYQFFKGECRRTGIAAALLFACYHIALGPMIANQRDFWMLPFLVAGCHFFANYLEDSDGQSRRNLLISGVCVGAAMMIKPLPVVLPPMLFLIRPHLRAWRTLAVDVVVLGMGVVIAALPFIMWFAARGALGDVIRVLRYLPIYSRYGPRPSILADAEKIFVVATLACLVAASTARGSIRTGVLLAGCLYGLAHFYLQAFPWPQRLHPLRVFVILLVFYNLRRLAGAQLLPKLATATALAAALVVCSPAVLADPRRPDADQARREYAKRAMREADLARAFTLAASDPARPDDGLTMHFFDTVEGFYYHQAALHATTPSNCFSPSIFFVEPQEPAVQALQRRCIAQLRRSPPKLIVIAGFSYPYFDRYYVILDNPLMRSFLDEGYRLVVDRGDYYRIYARTARSR
ncbi:MAG TPA: glycosyltransferase family 39 protein [Vicinamibacterales bacterium]|nr:glycosyltransferase family 39 protein [Vicinamibacterales bacterium]